MSDISLEKLPTPTPADADPVLGPMLNQFVACVCAELAAAGRAACACCLVWGDTPPPGDFCDCDCTGGHGQAWVRVVRWDPPLTLLRQTAVRCTPWRTRVWLEAGVYRCVSAGSYDGQPPTCDERAADAWGFIKDARILRTAAKCCAAFKDRSVEFVLEEPMGMRGGCSGVMVQFNVELT